MNRRVSCFVALLWLASTAAAAADAQLERLRARLVAEGVSIERLVATPIAGLYEVTSDGRVVYVSADANYMVEGELIDLRRQINLTDRARSAARLAAIDALGESQMLVYPAHGATTATLSIFTDTSCPFCARLHAELETLRHAGIRVRYLLYPRAGIGSPAHAELESVWCADDPQAAMTLAKRGGRVEARRCDNPIERHIALAREVGLVGTPYLFLDNGITLAGYREPAAIIELSRLPPQR